MIWFLLLIPLFILLPELGSFVFPPGSPYSDLLISHFPNAFFLQNALSEWGQVPGWSPQILSGTPFLANPLSGVYYFPGWLALTLPAPVGFHFALLAHILWGGIGMAVWLRSAQVGRQGALTGALLFEGMPKLWAHLAAGHVTLVYALVWTPWLMWAENRRNRTGASWLAQALPGVFLAVIFLADPRWCAYSGLLWLAYLFYQRAAFRSGEISADWRTRLVHWTRWAGRSLGAAIGTILLAGLLAAPLLLPLAEYTRLSTRSALTPADTLTLSLPAERLINLLLPDPAGPAEWTLYPGSVGLLLAGLALSATRLRRRTAFWLVTCAVVLLFALGSAFPPNRWVALLPGMSLLRVPPRALFLLGLALAVIAAHGVDGLTSPNASEYRIGRLRPQAWVAGLAELSWLFVIGLWVMTGKPNTAFLIAAGGMTVSAATVLLRLQSRIRGMVMAGVMIGVVLAEAILLNRMALDPVSPALVYDEASQAAAYLKVQPGRFRVFSPSYSIPQHTAARYGLELADGVDPLQLKSYADFMERASGVNNPGYSVTVPAFANGEPATDNRLAVPDPRLLGLLNVRYVVSEYEINRIGLSLQARFGNTRIYLNERAQPRAWLESGSAPEAETGGVELLAWRPNQIRLRANGPGRLVLSEIVYPGWDARVNGEPRAIEPYAGLLRSVLIEPGEQEVVFTYRPVSAGVGLGIGLGTTLVLLSGGLLGKRKPERRPGRNKKGLPPG